MKPLLLYFLCSLIANGANLCYFKTFLKRSTCDYCKTPIKFQLPIFSGLYLTTCCKNTIKHYFYKELFIFIISLFLEWRLIIVFYCLFILSEYDILHLEIYYPLFFIMIIIQYFTFIHYQFHYWIIVILLICCKMGKIGFADVVFIGCTTYFINNVSLYLFLTTIIGFIHFKLQKTERIPFLPALSISYFICLILQSV